MHARAELAGRPGEREQACRRSRPAPSRDRGSRSGSRAASARAGNTFWPPSSSSSANWPSARRSGAAGTGMRRGGAAPGRARGRRLLLSTGAGAVALTGPSSPRSAMARTISRTRSSRWIQLIICRARRRTARRGRIRTGPASAPACRRRGRAPGRCAAGPAGHRPRRARAASSQAAQRSWLKQGAEPDSSSSGSSSREAVPADRRAADHDQRPGLQPRDQPADRSGDGAARFDDPRLLRGGPGPVRDRLAGEVDDRRRSARRRGSGRAR